MQRQEEEEEEEGRNLEVYVRSVLETWPDLVSESPEDGEAKDGAGSQSDVRVMKLLADEILDRLRDTNRRQDQQRR